MSIIYQDNMLNSNDRTRLIGVTDEIVKNCDTNNLLCNISKKKIISKESVVQLVNDIVDLIYPGFYGNQAIDQSNLQHHLKSEAHNVFQQLTHQISNCTLHECKKTNNACQHCFENSQEQAFQFLDKIPSIRNLLLTDLHAAYRGDPAAKSYDEIIFSYPGFFAISVYRIAHELYKLNIPLLPRIMTEYAHCETGVDIHPGAEIEKGFFIDHGTGIVIGETTEIGCNVRMYQGVTLGALSFKTRPDGSLTKGGKRHPTIGDDVTIYAGATILGGETLVGSRSIIGGNVWLTHSIPQDTTIILAEPRLKTIENHMPVDYQI
ncbi:MAG: serine acetyltransferase [Candidatus Bathyarchaeota archaeon]|nr:serine acetyltransferase [Candidatus Bathyarchaeota archaeon]